MDGGRIRGGDIVKRASAQELCRWRHKTLEQYEIAYDKMREANDALSEAGRLSNLSAPTRVGRYNSHITEADKKFVFPKTLPKKEEFIESARRVLDTDIWQHLFFVTDLNQLMDKKAKDDFHQSVLNDVPHATIENVTATVLDNIGQADHIFRRGLANCFSRLDRRFRSHDGFKLGSRVILDRAFDEYGSWCYGRSHQDTLIDIERVFHVLDDKVPPPDYAGIVGAIDDVRRGRFGPHQAEVESAYFRAKTYINGNLHLWFVRKDLLVKVNQLLAEYYGEVLGDGRPDDIGESDVFSTTGTAVAKNFGFYPTPDRAAESVIEHLRVWKGEPLTVLEPSAGRGALARRAVERGQIVDVIEIQPHLAEGLREEGIYRKVQQVDFLALRPDPDALYDRVIMNPPFDRELDIIHVMHAMKFLKPGGQLVAVMSAGTELRETKRSIAFREFMTKKRADWQDLPAGSFAESGTYINTVVLTVWNR